MSGINPRSDTWHNLIQDSRDILGLNGTAGTGPQTTTESEYRETLTTLCAENRVRDAHRQINRFRRYHVPMIDFVTTIDAANRHQKDDALQPLIWQLMTCAATANFRASNRFRDVAEATEELNQKIPEQFSRDNLATFPYEQRVQKPLREVFIEYFACYLSMFQEFATVPGVLCLEQYHQRIQHAADYFLPRASEWEAARKAAEAEMQDALGTASVGSGTYGSASMWSASSQAANFQFRPVKRLGSGSWGEVWSVMEPTTKVLYAQKLVCPRPGVGNFAQIKKQVKSEAEIMRKLRHNHIVSILLSSQDGHAFRLIMHPVADYDLRVFLEEYCTDAGYPRDKLRHLDNWFGCLTSALAFAHGNSVKHEDIKPANILIKDDQPYLSDFGSAKDFALDGASNIPDELYFGSLVYHSPEDTRRGRAADIFALGCVFSEMLTVRQKRSLEDYRNARRVQDSDCPSAFRKNLPAVDECLTSLPGNNERNRLQDLLAHVIRKMLEPDPEERPNAKDVKRLLKGEEESLFCVSCS